MTELTVTNMYSVFTYLTFRLGL